MAVGRVDRQVRETARYTEDHYEAVHGVRELSSSVYDVNYTLGQDREQHWNPGHGCRRQPDDLD